MDSLEILKLVDNLEKYFEIKDKRKLIAVLVESPSKVRALSHIVELLGKEEKKSLATLKEAGYQKIEKQIKKQTGKEMLTSYSDIFDNFSGLNLEDLVGL